MSCISLSDDVIHVQHFEHLRSCKRIRFCGYNKQGEKGITNMIRWLLFCFAVSSSAFGQHVIEGKVVDNETGKPIPFASISLVGTSKGTTCNLNGVFSLAVSDSVSIKVTCVGYESQVLNSLEEMHLIKLKPIATQLKEVY